MWAWIVKSEPILFHHAALTVNGLGLTRITLFFRAHTDPTDLTDFFLMALNLTDALRRLAPKAHTDSTDSTKKRRISVFYKPQISTN